MSVKINESWKKLLDSEFNSEYFKNLKNQGEIGRKKITQYTRYGTVLLATIQGYGVAVGLQNSTGVVLDPGIFFKFTTVISLVTGTIFLMWLGEQITQRGIGNSQTSNAENGVIKGDLMRNYQKRIFQKLYKELINYLDHARYNRWISIRGNKIRR